MNQEVTDKVVLSVMAKYAERSATGLKKYGTTLDREDLTLDQWINHFARRTDGCNALFEPH
jgi:hypothetical protein